ncbi:hypothetical protein M3603_12755 [Rummeliibacillus stabekisii]|uniref:hypothetical protein n=1 Tax=Rummeliibacillus stabekisii TaxID=241244 RepID=UPI0020406E84|nr:hypothetical protein [Rummeliibacillus stabekisii]MCM3317497.1 hypothetical protein [Rummeliibacillus stabekisii]
MLKNNMYGGILLGAILLAGCSLNGGEEEYAQVKEKATEEGTNGRAAEVETLPDKVKGEGITITPIYLTQEQKKEYYKQYEEILKKVNSEYEEDLELSPLEAFKSEEWVTPEDFEQIAIDMATLKFTSKEFGGDPVAVE